MRVFWLLALSLVVGTGCDTGASAPSLCTPGTEIVCRCLGGDAGTKLCNADGAAFGECRLDGTECAAPAGTSAGATGSGGSVGGDCASVNDLLAGDLVIGEIMSDPAALPDAQGEWFEIENARDACLDLDGLAIESPHDAKTYILTGSVLVAARDRAVICRDSAALATVGVPCDHDVGGAISLDDDSDALALKVGGTVIDAVAYTSASAFPPGVARTLDPSLLDSASNDSESAWCAASSAIPDGAGDRGTPGDPNDPCP